LSTSLTNTKSWNANEEDEEAWDILFPHRTEDVGNYLNPEGSDGDIPDIGSSAQIEVATQRDETEDVGTLETSKAPIENIPLPIAPTKTPAPEVPPTVEAAATEHVTTIENVSIETPQGEVAGFEAFITITNSAGNDCSVLNSANIFYIRC